MTGDEGEPSARSELDNSLQRLTTILGNLKHSPPPKVTPDDWQTQELFLIKADNGKLVNLILKEDMNARRHYARALFIMICIWLGVVLGIVILVGLRVLALSEATLITLVSTTTASVIGLFAIVARYFYRQTHHVVPTSASKAED